MRRSTGAMLAGVAAALLGAAGAAAIPTGKTGMGAVVLLDEYWTPDVAVCDVVVTEVDTAETGDPTEARFGEVSVLLANVTGWPSVRFRNSAAINFEEYPPQHCEASIWYRTDAWEGPWRLEIWAHNQAIGPVPVKVMEAVLEGEGEDGKLLADGEWHEARGAMFETEHYGEFGLGHVVPTYVWLSPIDGWDTVHETYVDRIELRNVSGANADKPMKEPAARVRPVPGAFETGDGWVWWEGEDRVSDTCQVGGSHMPDTAEGQKALSNGTWLGGADSGAEATWEIEVPEAGEYELWVRGYWWLAPFRWRFDDAEWRQAKPAPLLVGVEWVRWGAPVCWGRIGKVKLDAGEHALTVVSDPAARAHCDDCWVLSREPFEPRGKLKPDEEPAEAEQ